MHRSQCATVQRLPGHATLQDLCAHMEAEGCGLVLWQLQAGVF
jgi:hypothetical protein